MSTKILLFNNLQYLASIKTHINILFPFFSIKIGIFFLIFGRFILLKTVCQVKNHKDCNSQNSVIISRDLSTSYHVKSNFSIPAAVHFEQ